MSLYRLGAGFVGLAALLMVTSHATLRAQDANREEVFSKSDISDIVDRVARRSGEFKEEFNKALEHTLLDGTKLEGRAKHRADEFHDAASRLRDVYRDKKDKNNPAVREQVDRTLAAASELSNIMTSHRFTDKAQRDWELLRSDLNVLADIYGLTHL